MKLRVVFGLLVMLLVLRWIACEPTDSGPVKHLTNRLWVNKVAKGPRDMVFHLALMGRTKRRIGFVLNASRFRFMGEFLRYKLDGHRLTLKLPQDKAELTFKVRTWACKEAPKPYDLCLELKRDDHTMVLYSQRKATVGVETLEALGIDVEAAMGVDGDGPTTTDVVPASLMPLMSGSED